MENISVASPCMAVTEDGEKIYGWLLQESIVVGFLESGSASPEMKKIQPGSLRPLSNPIFNVVKIEKVQNPETGKVRMGKTSIYKTCRTLERTIEIINQLKEEGYAAKMFATAFSEDVDDIPNDKENGHGINAEEPEYSSLNELEAEAELIPRGTEPVKIRRSIE